MAAQGAALQNHNNELVKCEPDELEQGLRTRAALAAVHHQIGNWCTAVHIVASASTATYT
jgi:hypothetical protein